MGNKDIILKVFILLCALHVNFIAQASYDFKVNNIYYKINSDRETVNVSSTISTMYPNMTNTDYAGDIVVPESVTYNGKSYIVTGVESFCTFEYAKALRSVVLPATIKSLPSYAFAWCSALGKIVLGDNLVSIPDHCFFDCGALREVFIPTSVESIGVQAFEGCAALSSMTIPASVRTIGSSAFVGCKGLSELSFSDSPSLLRIGEGNYDGTKKSAFDGCPLVSIYMGRNIENLHKSGFSVFANHKTLCEITLGHEVSTISQSLFQNCTSLKSVTVQGANLKEIQDEAFRGCSQLHNFMGNALNSVEIIGEYSFANCPMLTEIILPQIKSIGKSAFYSYNGNLEKVFLGDNITVIPKGCFSSQSSLKYVYLGSSISSIEATAFNNCTGLISIFLFSENLVTLGDYAIPNTISKIYVPNPSRYDNLLKDYYRDYLIVINNTTNEYSGKAPLFSYKNNVEGSDVSFDSPDLNINVGEYNTNIDVNFKIGEWQSIAKVPANYSITPANLTIIASDASRQYGEDNPEFTCSFFGFKNNETRGVLTTQPMIETTATRESNVGTYPIIPFGAEAQNYTFTYERGKLNVTKADQEISWEQDFSDVRVGDIVELTAESSSGLAIKYTSTDETIAEIFTQNGKKHVEFLKDGNVSIRANQEGNENYNEADRVSKSIEIKSMSGINDVELDNRSNIDIYNCNGVILHKSVPREVLKSLTPGLYIIIQNGNAEKIMIQ
ncbi:MAG: leucine-rich repeat protein [Muribaculaceae bacterium]|nr:leucine-rich repeat protein [Muribaculaceae bacterium]